MSTLIRIPLFLFLPILSCAHDNGYRIDSELEVQNSIECKLSYEKEEISGGKKSDVGTPIHTIESFPRLLTEFDPMYPEALFNEGIEGMVKLTVLINKDGCVENASVMETTHHLFSESALEAIYRTRFLPGYSNGYPVKVLMRMPVRFEL